MDDGLRRALAQALSAWSLGVQVAVAAVMVVVFFSLWLSSKREAALTWDVAWLFDLAALLAVLAATVSSGAIPYFVVLLLYLAYAATKVGFAALLVVGLEQFRRKKRAMGETARTRVAVAVALLFVAVLVARPPMPAIQGAVFAIVAALTGYGGISVLTERRRKGTALLPAALLLYSAVFFHHAVALFPVLRGGAPPGYMGHISFVDAGAEVLLGVVLLLTLGNAAVEEMAEANARLEAAQRWLRELVDADPLTGLHNRRGLRRFLTEMGGAEGVLIYLDVDRFKSINDRWGHAAGDACLRRVADGLREVFRNEDGKFRMGGDEFLVVAPGLDPEDGMERIERLRGMLATSVEGQPAMGLSAGIAPFTPGTPMDEALASADHAMYRDKEARRS